MTRRPRYLLLAAGWLLASACSGPGPAPPTPARAPAPRPVSAPPSAAQILTSALALVGDVVVLNAAPEWTGSGAEEVARRALGLDGVVAAGLFVWREGTLAGSADRMEIGLKGLDPAPPVPLYRIADHMVEGAYDELADAGNVLIGSGVADRLGLGVGDAAVIELSPAPPDRNPWTGATSAAAPHRARVHIAGVFELGVGGYDERMVVASLDFVRTIIGLPDAVDGVDLRVRERERAESIAAALEQLLGGWPYAALDYRRVLGEL